MNTNQTSPEREPDVVSLSDADEYKPDLTYRQIPTDTLQGFIDNDTLAVADNLGGDHVSTKGVRRELGADSALEEIEIYGDHRTTIQRRYYTWRSRSQ
jgi:hypothetical protein